MGVELFDSGFDIHYPTTFLENWGSGVGCMFDVWWCKCGALCYTRIRKRLNFSFLRILKVIRLGLEPKTPTLKVLCSTN